ncbi:40S ribosomal protein S4 [Zea mays]|uniref:40S ribosomal protein S4 n=1 Tax=Zea mays TaxID=4577 RepID=A0A317YCW2_MAIZE|nr:40S ribosomal protein S4 [Zea mays]
MALARWSLDLASAPAPPVAKARPLIAPPVAEARGLKKHLKSLSAPKHWMLDKLGGAFAPKPSSGPHKSRECLPLILIIRNMLKYALTYCEVISILMQRHVLVDGKVRTDKTYPAGFMDLCTLLYCPYMPIKANDTIKIDLETNKIMDFIKFDIGNVVMVTGGRNTRHVGVIKNREKHKGSFETIHVLLGAFCYV